MKVQVFLFAGMFGRDTALFEEAARMLQRRFGKVCSRSDIFDFTHTDYYTEEMGKGLKKIFFVFDKPILPENLPDIKLYTIRLESRFSTKESNAFKRKINIDPGYLSLNKVVLATTKDYSHRLYLGKGIYGEVTLFYKSKTFTPFPWTYPDYRTSGYIDFFNAARILCYNRPKRGGGHD